MNATGLAENWLDTSGSNNTLNNCYYTPYQWGYQYYPIYQTVTTPTKPIRLTFEEIQTLRDAAHNKSLKDILVKFTSLIEVIVEL